MKPSAATCTAKSQAGGTVGAAGPLPRMALRPGVALLGSGVEPGLPECRAGNGVAVGPGVRPAFSLGTPYPACRPFLGWGLLGVPLLTPSVGGLPGS